MHVEVSELMAMRPKNIFAALLFNLCNNNDQTWGPLHFHLLGPWGVLLKTLASVFQPAKC